jgi:hypothetical protein
VVNKWKKLIETYTHKEQQRLLEVLIARLMECEEISYFDGTDPDIPEMLYWDGSGENIVETSE